MSGMMAFTLRSTTALAAMVLALPLLARGQQSAAAAEAPAGAQPMAATPVTPSGPRIDPKADEILKKMSKLLADAKSVSFDSHAISDQITPDLQRLQYAKNQKVKLRRPDRLAADVAGDVADLVFRYDGKQVTLFNPRTNSWGSASAPGSINETLDMLAEKYGMVIPLADLVFPDPYQDLMEHVRSAEYLGLGYVFDTKCHHLAFREPAMDWEIWIQDGDQPLPRKMVMTFNDAPGHPEYTAFLSNWNLSADTPDSAFIFTPPPGAKQVEFAPAQAQSTPGGNGAAGKP
jgi:hypothetical protein